MKQSPNSIQDLEILNKYPTTIYTNDQLIYKPITIGYSLSTIAYSPRATPYWRLTRRCHMHSAAELPDKSDSVERISTAPILITEE